MDADLLGISHGARASKSFAAQNKCLSVINRGDEYCHYLNVTRPIWLSKRLRNSFTVGANLSVRLIHVHEEETMSLHKKVSNGGSRY